MPAVRADTRPAGLCRAQPPKAALSAEQYETDAWFRIQHRWVIGPTGGCGRFPEILSTIVVKKAVAKRLVFYYNR